MFTVPLFKASEFLKLQHHPGACLSAATGLGRDNPMVVSSLLCSRSPLSWGRQLSWLKEALPPVPAQGCAHCTQRLIHHSSWGLGTQSRWRRSLKCAPLSFPDPESTALCSDRLIYTKQALPKHKAWSVVSGSASPETGAQALLVVTHTPENHHCPSKRVCFPEGWHFLCPFVTQTNR